MLVYINHKKKNWSVTGHGTAAAFRAVAIARDEHASGGPARAAGDSSPPPSPPPPGPLQVFRVYRGQVAEETGRALACRPSESVLGRLRQYAAELGRYM